MPSCFNVKQIHFIHTTMRRIHSLFKHQPNYYYLLSLLLYIMSYLKHIFILEDNFSSGTIFFVLSQSIGEIV